MAEILIEYVAAGAGCRVDRQQGIIQGVKILGLESRNGRTYPRETLRRATGLYEGVKVNVNHPRGNPGGPRDYQDRIGTLRNVRVEQGDGGIRGDFHFNPKHALAEQLMWDAEHSPENVGFSHNVEAKVARRDGKTVVEEITRVQSVDLVADPATTRGLFESESPLAAKRRLVEEVADAINMPHWAIPPLETGLSYRTTRDEICEYLLDIKRILIARNILPGPLPVVTDGKTFAKAITGGGTEAEKDEMVEAIGGKPSPASCEAFDEAVGIPDKKLSKRFAQEIT
jgi:hypothetical protein